MPTRIHCRYCDGIFPDPHICPNLPDAEQAKRNQTTLEQRNKGQVTVTETKDRTKQSTDY